MFGIVLVLELVLALEALSSLTPAARREAPVAVRLPASPAVALFQAHPERISVLRRQAQASPTVPEAVTRRPPGDQSPGYPAEIRSIGLRDCARSGARNPFERI